MAVARAGLRAVGLQEGTDFILNELAMNLHTDAMLAGTFDLGFTLEPNATVMLEAVLRAMAQAAIERPEDAHFVQVKGPCLTAAALSAARSEGLMTAGDTPDKSMAWSRVASAFGVALALGEIEAQTYDPAAMLRDFGQYSSVASCSSGVEVRVNEIVVLGNSRRWAGPLHIAHRPMADALDIGAVHRVLDDLGLSAQPQLSADQRARLAAVFVKCEPDRSGMVRGQPHTVLATAAAVQRSCPVGPPPEPGN